MSEIVIRHAEPKDYDAIRQIHAQPEVYHNTLQVPHPSLEMWQARLTEQAGVKQLVACIDDIVVGHLSIQVTQTSPSQPRGRFWYLRGCPVAQSRYCQRADPHDDRHVR
ncbi:acetyltransferase [Salmonella enterica subsp. enterica]|uniref:Acetyltransferase n=1 Tax=Salmonella enterica I TaxID=59201 RepID=A0A379VKD8_SALET|nr:acetyltransferase [Salmonella enterica subsp. enterica]